MALMLQGNENRDRWVYLLIGVVCMPYFVTFFEGLFRALFGNFQWPSIGNMAWVSDQSSSLAVTLLGNVALIIMTSAVDRALKAIHLSTYP